MIFNRKYIFKDKYGIKTGEKFGGIYHKLFSTNRYNTNKKSVTEDVEVLKMDWVQVGQDLYDALGIKNPNLEISDKEKEEDEALQALKDMAGKND